jgi:hypothetical protein
MSGEDGATFDELLEAADRRMYEDKRQRRAAARVAAAAGTPIRLAHPSR